MSLLDPREWRGSFGPSSEPDEEEDSAEGVSIRLRIRRRRVLATAAVPRGQHLSAARPTRRSLSARPEPARRDQINDRD